MRLVILALLVAACTKPAPAPPRASTGSSAGPGSDDEFCADHGQHCGASSNAIGCCEPLVCVPNTDERGDVLVHQCVER